MKASLIFSSTSHSINIQKVGLWEFGCFMKAWSSNLLHLDIQDRVVEVVRSEVYDTRNRAGRRATALVPRDLGGVIPNTWGMDFWWGWRCTRVPNCGSQMTIRDILTTVTSFNYIFLLLTYAES